MVAVSVLSTFLGPSPLNIVFAPITAVVFMLLYAIPGLSGLVAGGLGSGATAKITFIVFSAVIGAIIGVIVQAVVGMFKR